MRKPGEQRNQEPRTTLGDHANMPLVDGERLSAKLVIEQLPTENAEPEWARNLRRYGGLCGEDNEPSQVLGAKIKKLRDVIGSMFEAHAAALYTTRTAMALLEANDAMVIKDKIDALHFSAQRTAEECARLLELKR